MAKEKRSDHEEKGLSYEEIRDTLMSNLETYEGFFYAQLRRQEGGENANRDAWTGARLGFQKVGLEGMLESLDAQVHQAIEAGDGLAGTLTASKAVAQNYAVYQGCVLALKAKDLIPYIQKGLGDIKLEIKEEYKDLRIAELNNEKASKEKKAYGNYLMHQLTNAVMAKYSSYVHLENARMANEVYAGAKGPRMIKLPNDVMTPLRAKKAA
ncbi:hypothetical protein A3K73_04630 [Candidatus Pacearchaeota archaeon RBG_13_36_9]|nr:MAG: hypothetical protein A3K73_04630 [Candidatus Pacearchaeota archaeon RBG_13_36_9]